jgi:Mg2+ and Co2+ transporter CorA
VAPEGAVELDGIPSAMPASGFVWIGAKRSDFEAQAFTYQAALQNLAGSALVDLHVSDLLNAQLPSLFDSTTTYDLMIFRRLAVAAPVEGGEQTATRDALPTIDTSAVGMVVYDRLLLSVHPDDCLVREHFGQRLLQAPAAAPSSEGTRAPSRLPTSSPDLMLRMVNHIVDGYLDLRRRLTRQFSELQHDLLDPKGQFRDWSVLLNARNTFHMLEDTCEDQHSAVQEWIDALAEWPPETTEAARRERELLRLRSRDVHEHIERVLTHVRRLEHSAEAAVQMHFSALSHRTNQIMRTLTVLTAIFLPLNLITGFFGMNFDALPLIHDQRGVWIAVGIMVLVAIGLAAHFWRKRYLSTRG